MGTIMIVVNGHQSVKFKPRSLSVQGSTGLGAGDAGVIP